MSLGNDSSNELDNWEWQWQLAVKLSKNEGLPVEEEYWNGLEEKIMSEVVKSDLRQGRKNKEVSALTRKGI
ncbi:MAG: hypothetical protein A4S09_04500 [Proteobacteria bacterium SG_bin7]|nr:MAG: hypothetical protein A4S09_04500 [Proteobacteria bacterium SG_bin7]